MKLGMKLLAAPLLTALVVVLAGQINAVLMTQEADKGQASLKASLEDFKTVASVQQRLGLVHASVYKTVALIGSLDEPKIKAFREDLAKQLASIKRDADALAEAAGAGAQLRSSVAEVGKQMDKYAKQADTAIDMSSVDPNTGIASMQGADATFSSLSKTMADILARSEAGSHALIADAQQRSLHYQFSPGRAGFAGRWCGRGLVVVDAAQDRG